MKVEISSFSRTLILSPWIEFMKWRSSLTLFVPRGEASQVCIQIQERSNHMVGSIAYHKETSGKPLVMT